ncbi:hypothetical protein PVIIG_01332 [Plasmodium vivax India VII]|uniref:Diphthamide biosynthesis protein 2 n=1 Tax=Plasmodium vivax India VII TaxID=1077284 RepID=A0A0J9S6L1_PLAVI|nr:hypothetical protein PVIIG_01332 [Plasmodium vivax India VII]
MGRPHSSDIFAKYQVELAAGIISKNNYRRVAVQLPDCMLEDSLLLSNAIQGELHKGGGAPLPYSNEPTGMIPPCCGEKSPKGDAPICGKEANSVGSTPSDPPQRSTPDGVDVYILGDTSVNECCEDYVSAEHVQADLLLHYGPSCQSFITPSIPSVYLFSEVKPEEAFYQSVRERFIRSNFPGGGDVCIVLCDVAYTGCMPRLVDAFLEVSGVEAVGGGAARGAGENRAKPLFLVDGRLVGGKSFLRRGGVCSVPRCRFPAAINSNIVVGLHRVATNVQGKHCYGDHGNYVELDAHEDLAGKYAFFCGRLLTRVLYSPRLGTLLYEVIRTEEMSPPWGTILTNGQAQRTHLFLFANGNVNLRRRCVLEYECCPDRVHICESEQQEGEAEKHLGANGNIEICHFEKKDDLDKLLLKRYSLIEKCKLVDTFGILMANVNLQKSREMKRCLSYILRSRGKKCFTIATNKLNGPKMENFCDVEMYILLSCPEKSFLEIPDFSKKIITPCELFIAYGYVDWHCNYLFEFFNLLAVPSVRSALDGLRGGKYRLWSLGWGAPSLVDVTKGALQSGPSVEGGTTVERGPSVECTPEPSAPVGESPGPSNSLLECHPLVDPSLPIPPEEQKKFITTFDERSPMCRYFLETLVENASREYRGVEMNYNTETVPEVLPGDDGIAQRYEADLRFCG